jgi:hypothetical protein
VRPRAAGSGGSAWLCAFALAVVSSNASAQTLTQRGFVDGSVVLFPQEASNDPTRLVGDLLARDDVFVKPAPWLQFAGGIDLRANTHDQVEDSWRVDLTDRTIRRPRVAVRRLSATVTRGPLTVDAGKQFIRWGKTDIVTPTDRFAPRDFLNVIDTEFIAVIGVRSVVQVRDETFEGVWLPRFTPSRVPLLDQRWTVVTGQAAELPLVDAGSTLPGGSQAGVRWSHVGGGFEYSLSFFDGFNHLPNIEAAPQQAPLRIEVARVYPSIRTYGGDAAVPTRWATIKGEAAYFSSSFPRTDEYVLYVVQLERQSGEWAIVAGYAGEVVTTRRTQLTFAPDRGLTRSIVARASYTIGPTRNVGFETAVRQNGDGLYARAEYSQARGAHWRATVSGVVIAGEADDFLGQYQRNSHIRAVLRYSF